MAGSERDLHFMRRALELADRAGSWEEVPVGAGRGHR